MYLCVLISDLTQKYGPVVRQARVVGVLDAAFDVLVPEFCIEKRVHVDQMPIDVSERGRFVGPADPSAEPRFRRAYPDLADILVG